MADREQAAGVRRAIAAGLNATFTPEEASLLQFPLVIDSSTGALGVDDGYAAALEREAAGSAAGSAWGGPVHRPLPLLKRVLWAANIRRLQRLHKGSSHGMLLKGNLVSASAGGVPVAVKVMRVTSQHWAHVNNSAYMDPVVGARASEVISTADRVFAVPTVYATVMGQARFGKADAEADAELEPAVAVITEYVQGRQLHGVLQELLLPPWTGARAGQALALVVAAVRALHALHTRVGAVHNDPHLGNLLVTRDGRVVLMDFGRASLGAAVPTEQLAAYPDWAQKPLPASADMALLCAMLVAGQPLADTWARMGRALAAHHPALARALVHLGSDLLPRALQCGGRDNMLQLFAQCQATIQRRAQRAAADAVPSKTLAPEACPVALLTPLRDPHSKCWGVSPAAWLRDPVLLGGLDPQFVPK